MLGLPHVNHSTQEQPLGLASIGTVEPCRSKSGQNRDLHRFPSLPYCLTKAVILVEMCERATKPGGPTPSTDLELCFAVVSDISGSSSILTILLINYGFTK